METMTQQMPNKTRDDKKLVTTVTKDIIEAIKTLGAYERATCDLSRDDSIDMTFKNPETGKEETHSITKEDCKNFTNNLIDVIRSNEKRALACGRTRGQAGKTRSGLTNVNRLNDNMVSFFQHADFGPKVVSEGENTFRNMKQVPSHLDIEETDDSLASALHFIQGDAKSNPLYGIAPNSLLIPLFSLHAYYTDMADKDNAKYMSASDAMRKYLSKEMEAAIHHDVQEYVNTSDDDNAEKALSLEKQLIKAIKNPKLLTDPDATSLPHKQSKSGVKNLFNPNRFIYGHFGKIISVGKVTNSVKRKGPVALKKDDLASMRPAIKSAYAKEFSDAFDSFAATYDALVEEGTRNPIKKGESLPYEEPIYEEQQHNVVLAGAYKKRRH